MQHRSRGISKRHSYLTNQKKALWKQCVFIIIVRQGSVNFAYLAAPTATGLTKSFSSIGLLSYLNFLQATISLERNCFQVLAGSNVRWFGRTI